MALARLARHCRGSVERFDVRYGRSNFALIERLFPDTPPEVSVRRLFSLARAAGCTCLSVEKILPEGAIAEENSELARLFPGCRMGGLLRLSFWRRPRETDDDNIGSNGALAGYALCKLDILPNNISLEKVGRKVRRQWHVFEAVFERSPYPHNYSVCAKPYRIRVLQKEYWILGVMYCQQNGLNKSCAQVALRTLGMLHAGEDNDVPYNHLNGLATDGKPLGHQLGKDLSAVEIMRALTGLGLQFDAFDYTLLQSPALTSKLDGLEKIFGKHGRKFDSVKARHFLSQYIETQISEIADRTLPKEIALKTFPVDQLPDAHHQKLLGELYAWTDSQTMDIRNLFENPESIWRGRLDHPYQKYLYAGVESGTGALLGFHYNDDAKNSVVQHHIVPVFGHTFNQDTWVPRAEQSYFSAGAALRFLVSDSWLSSFIIHDDNFGANYCLPKLFLKPQQVDYVLALRRPGIKYSGLVAEALAAELFLEIVRGLKIESNAWLQRLLGQIDKTKLTLNLVFRTIAVSRKELALHYQEMKDWEGKSEAPWLPKLITQNLPEMVWLIEISVHELFPINKRKIAEIVLDATSLPDETHHPDLKILQYARFPSAYILWMPGSSAQNHSLIHFPSNLESHTPVFQFPTVEH